MISSINFGNFNQVQIRKNNSQQPTAQQSSLKPLAQDTVNFTGAAKILTDVCDKAFVDILAKDLELGEQYASKLKNAVWEFLRENKIRSLGDIGGEEHFDEQVELVEKIRGVIDIPDDMGEYLGNEVVKRCDEGKDYIPEGLARFKENNGLFEDLLRGEAPFAQKIEELCTTQDDDSLYQFAKKMLRQTPQESFEFRATVDDFLEENNIKSLKELFTSEDLLNEQAALVERLEKKFDLDEYESMALNFEFLKRAFSRKSDYTPMTTPFVKDIAPLRKVVEDGEISAKGDNSFANKLFNTMSDEAEEKELNNIFELIKPINNPTNSRTFEFIENSGLTDEQKANLLIDLSKVADDVEEFASKIPKQPLKDAFYTSIQTDMISKRIADEFGISGDLSDMVKRIFPTHIEGGKNCDCKQIAFEIADKYKLESGAEKKIEAIIKEFIDGGTELVDRNIISNL